MLREMIETVDVQPWTIEPRIDASKFGNGHFMLSEYVIVA